MGKEPSNFVLYHIFLLVMEYSIEAIHITDFAFVFFKHHELTSHWKHHLRCSKERRHVDVLSLSVCLVARNSTPHCAVQGDSEGSTSITRDLLGGSKRTSGTMP